MVDLVGGQAGHNVVSVGQEQSHQPDHERGQRRGQEPGARGVVGGWVGLWLAVVPHEYGQQTISRKVAGGMPNMCLGI